MQIFNLFHLYGPICCITLHLINQGLVRLVKTGINFQATCHPEIKKKKIQVFLQASAATWRVFLMKHKIQPKNLKEFVATLLTLEKGCLGGKTANSWTFLSTSQ